MLELSGSGRLLTDRFRWRHGEADVPRTVERPDISWDETAKYIAGTPGALEATAALISKYPDRFLFGSDVIAPSSIESPMKVYALYEPLWGKLSPEVSQKVRLGNYERLFDAARQRVRAWDEANAK